MSAGGRGAGKVRLVHEPSSALTILGDLKVSVLLSES